jgi:xanthine/uracil/vitamin C permease (AzgA family)
MANIPNKWKILKNIIDLEYKKLLQEYSAILIAMFSITIAFMALIYTITDDISLTFISGILTYLILNQQKENKEIELEHKINETKNLIK